MVKYGRVSCERVLSGQGLVDVFGFLAEEPACRSLIRPETGAIMATPGQDPAAAISQRALAGTDPVCEMALALFCSVLGAVAGNLGLMLLATGGVFVAGGIAPRILPYLQRGTFRERSIARGGCTPWSSGCPPTWSPIRSLVCWAQRRWPQRNNAANASRGLKKSVKRTDPTVDVSAVGNGSQGARAAVAVSGPARFDESTRVRTEERFGRMVGRSPAMQAVFDVIGKASTSEATILLEGETGTGKEISAEAIHRGSPRRDKPFLVVDCGAMPPNLLESELFGHERGAFTGAVSARQGVFEAAAGGTVFLDEIGELALDLQPKLLRVLERREVRRVGTNNHLPVNVRLIAATNRSLRQQVAEQKFRSDLYYRLAVVEVKLPPLRERLPDLPLLVEHIVRNLGTVDEQTLAVGARRRVPRRAGRPHLAGQHPRAAQLSRALRGPARLRAAAAARALPPPIPGPESAGQHRPAPARGARGVGEHVRAPLPRRAAAPARKPRQRRRPRRRRRPDLLLPPCSGSTASRQREGTAGLRRKTEGLGPRADTAPRKACPPRPSPADRERRSEGRALRDRSAIRGSGPLAPEG
jgi:hypothetical protein